jgi:hypothetical protein
VYHRVHVDGDADASIEKIPNSGVFSETSKNLFQLHGGKVSGQ